MAYSADACREAAIALGLTIGSASDDAGYAFEGEYGDAAYGCFSISASDDFPSYVGKVYYTPGGTIEQMQAAPVDLVGTTFRPPGYDCNTGIKLVRQSQEYRYHIVCIMKLLLRQFYQYANNSLIFFKF